MLKWPTLVFSAACLVVSMLTLVLWPLGFWRSDVIVTTLRAGGPHYNVRNVLGRIVVVVIDDSSFPTKPRAPFYFRDRPDPVRLGLLGGEEPQFDVGGLTLRTYDWTMEPPAHRRDAVLIVPLYLIAVVTFAGAMPALVAMRRWRRDRRLRAVGRCRYCGYDLRASPERCPECGRPNDATQRLTPGAGGSSSAA